MTTRSPWLLQDSQTVATLAAPVWHCFSEMSQKRSTPTPALQYTHIYPFSGAVHQKSLSSPHSHSIFPCSKTNLEIRAQVWLPFYHSRDHKSDSASAATSHSFPASVKFKSPSERLSKPLLGPLILVKMKKVNINYFPSLLILAETLNYVSPSIINHN